MGQREVWGRGQGEGPDWVLPGPEAESCGALCAALGEKGGAALSRSVWDCLGRCVTSSPVGWPSERQAYRQEVAAEWLL